MGREEWLSVLKLSTLWRFKELRTKALNRLSQIQIDPVDKVILARDYGVEGWLVEGYTELVKRDEGLSSEARRRLGYETALQLYVKREDTYKRGLEKTQRTSRNYNYPIAMQPYSNNTTSREFDDLETEIRSMFHEELAGIRYDGDDELVGTHINDCIPVDARQHNADPGFIPFGPIRKSGQRWYG
jgi:hypothetical protein